MATTSFAGNLTRDPELRQTQGGKPFVMFTVAVNRWRGADREEATDFLNVSAFGTLADNIVQSLSKGDRVVVSGDINTFKKEVADAETGDKFELSQVSFLAEHVGPDLRFATVEVTRNPKGGKGSNAEVAADHDDTAAAAPAADLDDSDEF